MSGLSDLRDTVGVAQTAVAVTKNDTTTYANVRALYIGGAGDVALKVGSSTATAVTFSSVPAGTILPVNAVVVMSTNTTATGIVALL